MNRVRHLYLYTAFIHRRPRDITSTAENVLWHRRGRHQHCIRSTFFSASSPADLSSCAGGQQSRLLLSYPCRGLCAPSRQIAVRAERRRLADLLGKDVKSYQPLNRPTSLATCSGQDSIWAVRSRASLPSRYSALMLCCQSMPCC